MNSTVKLPKRISPGSRLDIEDSSVSGGIKKSLGKNKSEALYLQYKRKHSLGLQDSKLSQNVNLQIPSIVSPTNSASGLRKPLNKAACLKGFISKNSVSSTKNSKKYKSLKDSGKLKEFLFTTTENSERNYLDSEAKKISSLSIEIKKAMRENQKLKKESEQNRLKDEIIDDLMSSFKLRLHRLLFE